MAKQTPSAQLVNINNLLALYVISGNRKQLTQVRQAVTILLRSNPPLICRLRETFETHRVSMDIL